MAEGPEPVESADVPKEEEEEKEGERKDGKDGKTDEGHKGRSVKSGRGKWRGRRKWTRNTDQTTEKDLNEERTDSKRKDEDKNQESKRGEGRGKNIRQNRKRNSRARYKARKKAATEKALSEKLPLLPPLPSLPPPPPPPPGDGRGPNEKKEEEEEGAKQKQLPDTNIEQSEPAPNFDSDGPMHYKPNTILRSVMSLVGLPQVKKAFSQLCAEILVTRMQHSHLDSLDDCVLGAAFLGNPGTGRMHVAKLYVKFLVSLQIVRPREAYATKFECGQSLTDRLRMSYETDWLYDWSTDSATLKGVIFVQDAHRCDRRELEHLTTKAIDKRILTIFIGTQKPMQTLLNSSPTFSHFAAPRRFIFDDYGPKELRLILEQILNERYDEKVKLEGGIDGLYANIVARRAARRSGQEGFLNVIALRREVNQIISRQARRLLEGRQQWNGSSSSDPFYLTKDDLVGPDPSLAIKRSDAWLKLHRLIGLDAVKESVKQFQKLVQLNYERELKGEPVGQISLNRVFLGPPGTGKTTVARFYAQILADLGFLSKGEVIIKDPSDFIGAYIGASEERTKEILQSSVGSVLVIDEAHMLGNGSSDGVEEADSFRKAVVDTIVANVPGESTSDQCILLLGYKDEMEDMLQRVNPGLSRRFPLATAFHFHDYTEAELGQILDQRLQELGLSVSEEAKSTAMAVLRKARLRPGFGNAGEVNLLLDSARLSLAKRVNSEPGTDHTQLEPQDFDPEFRRVFHAEERSRRLFEGVVGCDNIISQMTGYQRIAMNSVQRGLDPREHIPFTFVFKGPPGTGKTTTARRIGMIFYDMGLLASTEVVECSITDLVGSYIGQTGPKTLHLFERAKGKVLFIDEAYRLLDTSSSSSSSSSLSSFAQEAVGEIVGALTNTRYAKKLVVVLAGYTDEMDKLLASNPGLQSRFPTVVTFASLTPRQCMTLLLQNLQQRHKVDITEVESAPEVLQQEMHKLFRSLSQATRSWGNARDVETIGESIYRNILLNANDPDCPLKAGPDMLLAALREMLAKRARFQELESML